MSTTIDLIAFDADDTLWKSETRYIAAQTKFCSLLAEYAPPDRVSQILHETEIRNLKVFGYGVKEFILSTIESALDLSDDRLSTNLLKEILAEGKRMITAPIELFDHVSETLETLAKSRDLMLITKGDLFEQETRIQCSGLAHYFTLIEVVSEKSEETYRRVFDKYHIDPCRVMMVGNSLRSDILPVVALGGRAVYIPYGHTWEYEKVDNVDPVLYEEIEHIGLLPELLAQVEGSSC